VAAVQAIWDADDRVAAVRETSAAMAESGHFTQALMTLDTQGIEDYLQTLCRWSPAFDSKEPGDAVAALREACTVVGWVRPEFNRLVDLLQGSH
jgi:hypothetical protein